jgi:hypothetical protein
LIADDGRESFRVANAATGAALGRGRNGARILVTRALARVVYAITPLNFASSCAIPL